MTCCQVWQGVDRLEFFENAILLEFKYRSQGHPVKMLSPSGGLDLDPETIERKDALTRESRAFLDDFALVASGPGGPDNVSAVCMETSERDDQTLVLRVARNGGLNDEMISGLRSIIRSMTESVTAGSSDQISHGPALRVQVSFHAKCKAKQERVRMTAKKKHF